MTVAMSLILQSTFLFSIIQFLIFNHCVVRMSKRGKPFDESSFGVVGLVLHNHLLSIKWLHREIPKHFSKLKAAEDSRARPICKRWSPKQTSSVDPNKARLESTGFYLAHQEPAKELRFRAIFFIIVRFKILQYFNECLINFLRISRLVNEVFINHKTTVVELRWILTFNK